MHAWGQETEVTHLCQKHKRQRQLKQISLRLIWYRRYLDYISESRSTLINEYLFNNHVNKYIYYHCLLPILIAEESFWNYMFVPQGHFNFDCYYCVWTTHISLKVTTNSVVIEFFFFVITVHVLCAVITILSENSQQLNTGMIIALITAQFRAWTVHHW